MKTFSCVVATAILAIPSLANAQSLEGKWEGSLSAAGMALDITVNFDGEGDALSATIDIPAQGAVAVPLLVQSHEHPNITFVINGVPGTPTFSGTHEADSITGSFTQGGAAGDFRLKRVEESDGLHGENAHLARHSARKATSGSTPAALRAGT